MKKTRPCVRVRLALSFIVLCALIFAAAPAWTDEPAGLVFSGEFEGGQAWRSSVGGYSVLSVKGNWHGMGRQYGGLLSPQLQEFYVAIKADLETRGLRPEHLEVVREIFDTYSDPMKELLRGMSETSGLSPDEHILLETSFYILPDLVIGQSKNTPSCSGIAVVGSRTAENSDAFSAAPKLPKCGWIGAPRPGDHCISWTNCTRRLFGSCT